MKLLHNLFFSAILFSSAFLSTPAISAEVQNNILNINTANAEQIASSMKGVGDSKAKAIVEYRSSHGKFTSLQDLENVAGIGERTVEINKEKISL